MKTTTLRIPEELAKKAEKHAADRNLTSMNDYYVEAIIHYLGCSKIAVGDDQSVGLRMIIAKYPDNCLKCGNGVKVGDFCLYARGVGVVCMDCYIQRIGDKALIAKYLKIREYKRLIHALEIEADRLAGKVEIGQFAEKLDALKATNSALHKALMEYLSRDLGTPEEKGKFEEILARSDETYELIRALQDYLMSKRVKKKERADYVQ